MARIIRCLGEASGQSYHIWHGDCVDVLAQLPDQSVGFSIYSPPFESLFTYNDSECDIGNNATSAEFRQHYSYVVRDKLRVTQPGRLTAVHCSDLPSTKWKDGIIGTKDFSGDIHDIHLECGWHFVRRITIWKDPVVEMTRTKSLNLLHKQIMKDSTKSWPGLADYIMLFRAPGENMEPVRHSREEFPVELWQKWASPVWMDIRQTNTLNVQQAKEARDEKHVCPIQLDLVERAIIMWSNKGNIVLSPFMGIGSEGYVAMKMRRRFIGVELKQSYFNVAKKNIDGMENSSASLFDMGNAA